MLKRHKLLLTAAAAAAIAATSVTAASASPHGHGVVSGTEYIQIMSASTTPGPASAIAHGAFTAAGEALPGRRQARQDRIPGRHDRAEP